MGDTFCVNVVLRIKEERRVEFLKVVEANQAGTLSSEPLALTYMYGEDANTRNTFHFHEAYQGKEGFAAHQKTPHFADWESFASTSPFTAEPEVNLFFKA